MTRADSDPSGEIQSVADPDVGLARFCIDLPNSRTAPTPTPAANAVARAWRRVMPRRAGRSGALAFSWLGATLMPPLNPGRPHMASAGCEEFVIGPDDGFRRSEH
jgi:hypothetical protein